MMVGRIDYLSTKGTVGDSMEFSSAEEMIAQVREDNYDGVPMVIVAYKNSGLTYSSFGELDPPVEIRME